MRKRCVENKSLGFHPAPSERISRGRSRRRKTRNTRRISNDTVVIRPQTDDSACGVGTRAYLISRSATCVYYYYCYWMWTENLYGIRCTAMQCIVVNIAVKTTVRARQINWEIKNGPIPQCACAVNLCTVDVIVIYSSSSRSAAAFWDKNIYQKNDRKWWNSQKTDFISLPFCLLGTRLYQTTAWVFRLVKNRDWPSQHAVRYEGIRHGPLRRRILIERLNRYYRRVRYGGPVRSKRYGRWDYAGIIPHVGRIVSNTSVSVVLPV